MDSTDLYQQITQVIEGWRQTGHRAVQVPDWLIMGWRYAAWDYPAGLRSNHLWSVHRETRRGSAPYRGADTDESTDAVLQEYRDKGIGVLPTGQFDVDFHYYLNTEPKLDFIYELGNCPKLDLPVGPVLDLPARKGLSSLTDSPNEEASLEEGSDGRLASEPQAMSHFWGFALFVWCNPFSD
jgi:hypothetical protein